MDALPLGNRPPQFQRGMCRLRAVQERSRYPLTLTTHRHLMVRTVALSVIESLKGYIKYLESNGWHVTAVSKTSDRRHWLVTFVY